MLNVSKFLKIIKLVSPHRHRAITSSQEQKQGPVLENKQHVTQLSCKIMITTINVGAGRKLGPTR